MKGKTKSKSKSGIERGWEHFPHDADIGVRGRGSSLHEAFEQAALALTAVVTDPQKVAPTTAVHMTCEGGEDNELLLVDWLNALVYEMSLRKMLFGRFTVQIDSHGLEATAWGETVEQARHEPAVEVKGATYTELRVQQDEQGCWLAQCVVDV